MRRFTRDLRLSFGLNEQVELPRILRGGNFGIFRRQSQVEAELLRKALSGPGCESFKMIADAGPNASYFGKTPLHFQSPTLERRFAFPKKFVVTVHVLPAAIIFCRVIAQETQIQK